MDPVLVRLLVVLAVVAGAGLLGWWWRRRDGTVRGVDADGDRHPSFASEHLARVGLDLRPERAGAVLLTSPDCGSCSSVARILDEVAGARDDFAWVGVDAAKHLDLAREHHVLRVPTLFVLDGRGRILARSSGVPARHEVEKVIDRQPA